MGNQPTCCGARDQGQNPRGSIPKYNNTIHTHTSGKRSLQDSESLSTFSFQVNSDIINLNQSIEIRKSESINSVSEASFQNKSEDDQQP